MADTYKIELITPDNDPGRGVAFLISEDRRVTSKPGFDSLDENTKRMFHTRFDYWLTGKPYERGYHRWDKSEFQGKYTNCLTFTCREERKAKRLYGFLCNRKPSNHRYCLCVLIRFASKTKQETDKTDLKIIEEMRTLPPILKAVDDYFKENP